VIPSRTKQVFTAAGVLALIAWKAAVSQADKAIATPVLHEKVAAVWDGRTTGKSMGPESATRASRP
jgi:hypothetical protein